MCYRKLPNAPPIEGDNDLTINQKDDRGQTELSHAAERGDEALVRKILQRSGVDMNAKDDDSRTPLSRAVKYGHAAVPPLFEQKNIYVQGHYSGLCIGVVCQLLERKDVNANERKTFGRIALSYAAEIGSEALIREILKRPDVDVNARDTDGRTPYQWQYNMVMQLSVHCLSTRILMLKGLCFGL